MFGMDTGIIGGVLTLPAFKAYVHQTPEKQSIPEAHAPSQRKYGLAGLSKEAAANLSANLVSTMQAGAFAGALLTNPIADKIGRKPGLLIVSVFAFIGGLLQCFAFGHLPAFYIGR